MNMTAALLPKLIGTIYSSDWCYSNFLISKILKRIIYWEVFIEILIIILRKVHNIVVMCKCFYFHFKRLHLLILIVHY